MTLFAGRNRVTGVACGTRDVNFDSFQPRFSNESCYGTKYQTCLPWEASYKIGKHNTTEMKCIIIFVNNRERQFGLTIMHI